MKNSFLILIIFSFLAGCQSTKDAFTLKKKNNSDEFLVEKKSPLVLPPDYGNLPLPSDSKNITEKNNETKISLENTEIKIKETIENSKPSSLEKSVIEKIK